MCLDTDRSTCPGFSHTDLPYCILGGSRKGLIQPWLRCYRADPVPLSARRGCAAAPVHGAAPCSAAPSASNSPSFPRPAGLRAGTFVVCAPGQGHGGMSQSRLLSSWSSQSCFLLSEHTCWWQKGRRALAKLPATELHHRDMMDSCLGSCN